MGICKAIVNVGLELYCTSSSPKTKAYAAGEVGGSLIGLITGVGSMIFGIRYMYRNDHKERISDGEAIMGMMIILPTSALIGTTTAVISGIIIAKHWTD